MLPVDTINTELSAGWFAFLLVFVLILFFGKQSASWLLMKLYDLFIGRENHLIDITC